MQKVCYAVYQSFQKFAFYLAGMECMLYCDHKPLELFFTTSMPSPMLDRWALELQQFNIKCQYIQGKRNIVADAISQLRTIDLYQEKDKKMSHSQQKMPSKT